jgi:5-methylthioadenosine/S-adenosylhomocysteine deaminase
MKTLIKDCLVVPMTAEGAEAKYFEGSVAIRGNRIALVTADRKQAEEWLSANPDARVVDGRGKLLMPGLVNTHTHVAMTLMRNFADDIPLMDWLNHHIWPFESHLGAEEIALGAQLGMAEMLLDGTTTLVDMYWHEEAIGRVAQAMGIRAVLCPCYLDGVRMDEFERSLPEVMKVASECDRLSVRVAPHSPFSVSTDNLKRGIDLALYYGIGMHTHVSETLDEQHVVRERYGRTPAEYLRDIGLFEIPTIAAHCVHVTPSDIEILARHGVTAVYNPQSNMKISSGIAPIPQMIEAGVNVAIGTDGASSNNDLDMIEEMRTGSFLQKVAGNNPVVMPAYQILRMATVGGAVAIGMGDSLGRIAEGMLADMVMLDIEKPHFYPRNDMIASIVYCAKAADVDTVFVDGRMVVSGSRVIGLDTEGLYRKIERTVRDIKARL